METIEIATVWLHMHYFVFFFITLHKFLLHVSTTAVGGLSVSAYIAMDFLFHSNRNHVCVCVYSFKKIIIRLCVYT